MSRLVGRSAEVSVAIPADGVGQVVAERRPASAASTSRARRTGGRWRAARRSSSPALGGDSVVVTRRLTRGACRRCSDEICFGIELSGPARRARDPAGAARRVRRDGAVRAQLHQGPALDGRHLLRPQAHPHRREGATARRSASAWSAAARRCGCRVLEQVAYLSLNIISIPLRIQRAYTKEGVAVTVEAVANVKIAERRHVAARRVGAFPRHVHRADQGRHLPDAGRPPARDSRHADRRGDQRRSPGVRAEDDRRGGARSEEDGRQHRHPDHPADQRRAGLSRRARQEADGRGQARCRHRRGPGARATR